MYIDEILQYSCYHKIEDETGRMIYRIALSRGCILFDNYCTIMRGLIALCKRKHFILEHYII